MWHADILPVNKTTAFSVVDFQSRVETTPVKKEEKEESPLKLEQSFLLDYRASYASAVYAMALCLCVRVHACVCHKSQLY